MTDTVDSWSAGQLGGLRFATNTDKEAHSSMTTSLQSEIRDFILENYLFTNDVSAIGLDESLLDRGIVDSTGMLEIIFFIEERLGVKIKDEEMTPDNLDSVNKIAQFVEVRRKVA